MGAPGEAPGFGWPIPGTCDHLGNEPVDRRPLVSLLPSLSNSAFQITEDKSEEKIKALVH